jgi:hypothetical protein
MTAIRQALQLLWLSLPFVFKTIALPIFHWQDQMFDAFGNNQITDRSYAKHLIDVFDCAEPLPLC